METSKPTIAQIAPPQRDIGGIAAAIGAVLIFALCASTPFRKPASDFIHFYAGGKLLGPGMYSVADTVAIGESIAPGTQTVAKPVYWLSRPPFYYLPFAALSRFSYYVGAAIWTITSFAGLALFLLCWPSSDRLYAFGYTALFLPLLNVLTVAQDTALLLGLIAGASVLHCRRWDFCAGALIGLCVAAKPSTLMFLPLAALVFGSWRMAAGISAAWAVAYMASAAIMADLLWPAAYVKYLLVVSPYWPTVPAWCIPIAAAALAWWCRGRKPYVVYAVLIAGWLALTPRALFYDLTLLLPFALILHGMRRDAITVAVCVFPFAAELIWILFALDGARVLIGGSLLGGMYLISREMTPKLRPESI